MYTISQSQNINGRHLKEFLPWPMQARKFHFYKGRNFYVFLWKIFRGSSILLNWKKPFFIQEMPGLFFYFFFFFYFFLQRSTHISCAKFEDPDQTPHSGAVLFVNVPFMGR